MTSIVRQMSDLSRSIASGDASTVARSIESAERTRRMASMSMRRFQFRASQSLKLGMVELPSLGIEG